jgi:fatty-acid desaturase
VSSTTELLQHPATEFALLSIAEGMAFVSLTTIYNHRQLTHESIELAPPAEHAARAVMWMLGVQPRLWAQVHLVHHSIEDANLLPIKETADYLHWRQDHSAPDHLMFQDFLVGWIGAQCFGLSEFYKSGTLPSHWSMAATSHQMTIL